jgi:hypothetical protein
MSLVFAVPLLMASSMFAKRGSMRALLCWMGGLFYVAYSYYFYVISVPFNVYFPLYVALVSMGTYGALALLFSIDLRQLPAYFERLPVRLIGAYLVVTSLAFAGRWLSILDMHYVAGTVLDPVSRTVVALDGVVLLPLLFYGGRALMRREPVGYALAGVLLVKAVATSLTPLVRMAIATRWGVPADGLQTVAYCIGLAGAAILLLSYMRCITTPPAISAEARAFGRLAQDDRRAA